MTEDTAIVAFLKARLDEDQAVAREAAGLTECWVAEEPAIGVVLVDGEPLIEGHIAGLTAHIARHDPSRVLREVEAKRRLIGRYERAVAAVATVSSFVRGQDDGYRQACLDAIRDAATIYSEHPDYGPAWMAGDDAP